MTTDSFAISGFGENGWLARIPGDDPVAAALFANAAADRLRPSNGVIDCVAGVDSLVLRFDPSALSPADAKALLAGAIAETPAAVKRAATTIDIPLLYGGEAGPDFDDLCERLSLTPEQLVERHSSQTYCVLTIGFAPGFAYLGPLPEALRAPRLDTPRPRVEAGSVAVAGAMTGVYPLASPGGWRIIGRTPKKLFDPKARDPFAFTPGAEVRFTPISAQAFDAMARGGS